MITENMTIQGLHVISLALTPIERWEAARSQFDTNASSLALLTGFAVLALTISVILLFWVFAKHRNSEHRLNLKIAELTVTNIKQNQEIPELKATSIKQRQEIAESRAANIKQRQEIVELTAINEKQRQEAATFYQKHIEVLENIAENPKEVNPSVKPSRN